MDSCWDIHDDMNLYTNPEYIIIEPNGKSEVLLIDRSTSIVKVQSNIYQYDNYSPTCRVCGILGTIHLLGGDYLIVATHRLYIGILNGAIIWRLAGYKIIPYIPTSTHLTPNQRFLNEKYLQMIRETLNTKYFYFSYIYDLTHTQQRFHNIANKVKSLSLFERADPRFVWNSVLLKNFNCPEMRRFHLPIILGFVSINQAQINGQTFFWSVISRRSTERAGTRLFCRGLDDDGHAANYVETEQIVEFNGQSISFVQTRGSIPFYWSQLPNLKYKPIAECIPGKENLAACTKHFQEQVSLYGHQVCVNLIDHKGFEGELEKVFRFLINKLNSEKIRYEAFDFHTECKKMRYDRLSILIDRIALDQDKFSVFHARDNGNLISYQNGVFRTNCIDCLDRTNVVQSMIARRSLNQVLEKLGVLQIGQKIETTSARFEQVFKGVWADNADAISLQYSGTGALKTDFTRTGKRTKSGLIQDGVNSMTRYYLNNFSDGFRQDGIDLFLGKYIVKDGEGNLLPSPLIVKKNWRYSTFPSILLFAVAMFFITAAVPSELNTENLLFLLFFGAIIGVSASGILHFGAEYVDWPKLFPPIKTEA